VEKAIRRGHFNASKTLATPLQPIVDPLKIPPGEFLILKRIFATLPMLAKDSGSFVIPSFAVANPGSGRYE
jgi:hypothetical protein